MRFVPVYMDEELIYFFPSNLCLQYIENCSVNPQTLIRNWLCQFLPDIQFKKYGKEVNSYGIHLNGEGQPMMFLFPGQLRGFKCIIGLLTAEIKQETN